MPKILENGKYEAVVGVACGEEIKLADKILEKLKKVWASKSLEKFETPKIFM